jgi:hypothetical protein
VQHRLEPVVRGIRAERGEPVERDPAARRVEPRLREAQDGRAVRDVPRQVLVTGGRLAEALDLRPREVGVRVGGREVAHQPDHLGRRPHELRKAPPPHPGVELQVHRHALGDDLVVDDELEARLACIRHLTPLGRAEHDEAGLGKLAAEHQRLVDGRRADRRRARAERGGGDIDRAVPVAVRLHDGPELRAVERAQQRRGVPPQRAEVDRELRPMHLPAPPHPDALVRSFQTGGERSPAP